jgi:hypothetical protein
MVHQDVKIKRLDKNVRMIIRLNENLEGAFKLQTWNNKIIPGNQNPQVGNKS